MGIEKIKEGWTAMKKMTHVAFTYEDGTIDEIVDQRACLLFQSRINSSGVVAGMGEWIVVGEDKNVQSDS